MTWSQDQKKNSLRISKSSTNLWHVAKGYREIDSCTTRFSSLFVHPKSTFTQSWFQWFSRPDLHENKWACLGNGLPVWAVKCGSWNVCHTALIFHEENYHQFPFSFIHSFTHLKARWKNAISWHCILYRRFQWDSKSVQQKLAVKKSSILLPPLSMLSQQALHPSGEHCHPEGHTHPAAFSWWTIVQLWNGA